MMKKIVSVSLLSIVLGHTVVYAASTPPCPCAVKKINKKVLHRHMVQYQRKNAVHEVSPQQPLPSSDQKNDAHAVDEAIEVYVPEQTTEEAPAYQDHEQVTDVATNNKSPVKHPLYLGMSVGRAYHAEFVGHHHQVASSFAGRIYGGYQLNDNIALETGYFKSAHYNHSLTGNADAGRSQHQGMDVLAVYRTTDFLPGLYAKAGIAYDRLATKDRVGYATMSSTLITPHSKSTYRGTRPLQYIHEGTKTTTTSTQAVKSSSTQDNVHAVLGVGYEFKVTDQLGIDMSYLRYQPVNHTHAQGMHLFTVGSRYAF